MYLQQGRGEPPAPRAPCSQHRCPRGGADWAGGTGGGTFPAAPPSPTAECRGIHGGLFPPTIHGPALLPLQHHPWAVHGGVWDYNYCSIWTKTNKLETGKFLELVQLLFWGNAKFLQKRKPSGSRFFKALKQFKWPFILNTGFLSFVMKKWQLWNIL